MLFLMNCSDSFKLCLWEVSKMDNYITFKLDKSEMQGLIHISVKLKSSLSSKWVSWARKVTKHPQTDVPETLLMQTDAVPLISPIPFQFGAEKNMYKNCYLCYSLRWTDWFLLMLLELVRTTINNLTQTIEISCSPGSTLLNFYK